jgi:hypothetical protein
MDKFINAEIDLINNKLADIMGGETVAMRAKIKILTSSIISVREFADDKDEEINPNMCAVYLTSGEFFILHTPYQEVVKILGWYW